MCHLFYFFAVFLLIITLAMTPPDGFKDQQKKFPRVKTAYNDKETVVKQLLADSGITDSSYEIFLRAFKGEAILELWVKQKGATTYKHIKNYNICSSSGTLGPKRKQGDGQVPEGFYHIDRFNPSSSYYLSLGLNYPNDSDRKLGTTSNLGGDIFIHGSCVTIGCMPLTDDKIKEVYLLAIEAKNSGQAKIPVHVFPTRLDSTDISKLKTEYPEESHLLSFWENLSEGYEYFEKEHKLPTVTISSSGKYIFK